MRSHYRSSAGSVVAPCRPAAATDPAGRVAETVADPSGSVAPTGLSGPGR